MSSGLLLTTKVGEGARGIRCQVEHRNPLQTSAAKPQRSPRAKETMRAEPMASNRRMFIVRSPVHKCETAEQDDGDGDKQYDHGLRVSLWRRIEGSPSSRQAEHNSASPLLGTDPCELAVSKERCEIAGLAPLQRPPHAPRGRWHRPGTTRGRQGKPGATPVHVSRSALGAFGNAYPTMSVAVKLSYA